MWIRIEHKNFKDQEIKERVKFFKYQVPHVYSVGVWMTLLSGNSKLVTQCLWTHTRLHMILWVLSVVPYPALLDFTVWPPCVDGHLHMQTCKLAWKPQIWLSCTTELPSSVDLILRMALPGGPRATPQARLNSIFFWSQPLPFKFHKRQRLTPISLKMVNGETELLFWKVDSVQRIRTADRL